MQLSLRQSAFLSHWCRLSQQFDEAQDYKVEMKRQAWLIVTSDRGKQKEWMSGVIAKDVDLVLTKASFLCTAGPGHSIRDRYANACKTTTTTRSKNGSHGHLGEGEGGAASDRGKRPHTGLQNGHALGI